LVTSHEYAYRVEAGNDKAKCTIAKVVM
jgi:hypothetical protein